MGHPVFPTWLQESLKDVFSIKSESISQTLSTYLLSMTGRDKEISFLILNIHELLSWAAAPSTLKLFKCLTWEPFSQGGLEDACV